MSADQLEANEWQQMLRDWQSSPSSNRLHTTGARGCLLPACTNGQPPP